MNEEEKTGMSAEELLGLAAGARGMAYAPYSGFAVGAALLGKGTSKNLLSVRCAEKNLSFKASPCPAIH